MDSVLSVGMSHQAATGRRMDIIANNIANASTTAYRAERVAFQDYLFEMDTKAPQALRELRFVLDYGIVPDMRQGAIFATGNTFDIALDGAGFLAVEGADGERLYSRAGSLLRNNEGDLTLQNGARVLGTNGQPIAIDDGDLPLEITADGTLRSGAGEIGRLMLVDFAGMKAMERRGDTLFATDQEELPPEGLRIVQGSLEGSNVNPIKEVTDMISVMRSYQSMERTLQSHGELRDEAIERLARVQA